MTDNPTNGILGKYRYVFVLTYGRSGSTILVRLMNGDPRFLIRGENLSALVHLAKSILAAERASARFAAKAGKSESPWFGAHELQSEHYAEATLGAFVSHILRPGTGVEVLGFKEIRYSPDHLDDPTFDTFCDFLIERFPDARLVFNTRDWRQVARSGWYRRQWPLKVRSMVHRSDARFRRVAERHPGRAIVFDHRDLFEGSPAVSDLLRFIGASVPPETVSEILSRRLMHARHASRRGYMLEIALHPLRRLRAIFRRRGSDR